MNAVPLTGWGRFPVVEAELIADESLVRASLDASLARGLGRAYGDAALPAVPGARVVCTPPADRMIALDPLTGVLRAEAGLSQRSLMRALLPRNLFTPVSPGTQFVTLGGMVASDIHGKNHHCAGTFGNFVKALQLRTGSGEIVETSREVLPELFWATLGGMGLTGHVLEVEVALERLPSPFIYEETTRHGSLREVFEHLTEASKQWPMTVAWVDTSARGPKLGRGIVMCGRWAEPHEAPPELGRWRHALTVPDVFPGFVMNGLSIKLLNTVYHAVHGAGGKKHTVGVEAFYYQLDMLESWNRGYGKRGFTQYQCVLPKDPALYEDFLRHFQNLGGASFVTVFKDCGPQGEGMLSFPKAGTSLALDIPMSAGMHHLIRELNAFVVGHGGRIYLAKDAFTDPDHFRQMYPRLDDFLAVRERYDPDRRISSALSQRLMGF